MSLPKISIVGRPNVGKSSLLNCLAGRRISIVAPTPGVTRDRITTTIVLDCGGRERYVEIVDTGGIGIVDADDLGDEINRQIDRGIRETDLIVFLLDGREGLTPLDRTVAEKLRRCDTPVLAAANKLDAESAHGETAELNRLGFGEPLEISALHQRNIDELLARVAKEITRLPDEQPAAAGMKLAVVGKRNAGKSTIINALVGQERVIVSETPGTTRDSVDVEVDIDGKRIILIDTAGLRRKKKLAGDVEFYSQHRAMRSIRRADVVAMVLDAAVPASKVDRNLAGVIADEFKPVLIVVNKWDIARERTTTEAFGEYFTRTFPSIDFAPICFTSAVEGLNLAETVRTAGELLAQARRRVGTGPLNRAVEAITAERGPSHKGGTRPPKIYYAAQVSVAPPTIVCFVNDTRSFDRTYRRFLVNRFREHLPYPEVPIRLFLRNRGADR